MTRGRLKDKVLAALTPSNTANRICVSCGTERPIADFPQFGKKHYLSHTCKFCWNEKAQQRRCLVACPVCSKLRPVRLEMGVPRRSTCSTCNRLQKAKLMQQTNLGKSRSAEIRNKIRLGHAKRPKMYPLSFPRNPTLGDLARINQHGYVWTACPACNTERWVRTKREGQPIHNICVKCLNSTPERREFLRTKELGRKHSPERIEKSRIAQLGKTMSDETRTKISRASRGRRLLEAAREKISIAQKKLWFDPDYRTRIQTTLRSAQAKMTHESRIEVSRNKVTWSYWQGRSIAFPEPTLIRELKERDTGKVGDIARIMHGSFALKATCELCEKPIWKRLTKDGNTRDRLCHSCASKVMHMIHSDIFALAQKKWQVSMRKSLHMRPNQAEKKLFNILTDLFPNEWAYTGDWSFILADKNPDFVNINGKKQIIDLFGDYWHKNDDPDERIALFRQFGYSTLVLWESELKDKATLTEKLRRFVLQ